MRKAVAMAITLVFLAAYAILAATIGSWITDWPGVLQLGYYVVAGLAWAFPLKPLMDWMNAPRAD